LDGATLTLTEDSAHKLDFATGDAAVTSVNLGSFSPVGAGSFTFASPTEILFSENITSVYAYVYYTVANHGANISKNLTLNSDITIDLTQSYKLYAFILPEATNYYGYLPLDIIATRSDGYSDTVYANTDYDADSGILSAVLTESYNRFPGRNHDGA
jgi:hypothetical protein